MWRRFNLSHRQHYVKLLHVTSLYRAIYFVQIFSSINEIPQIVVQTGHESGSRRLEVLFADNFSLMGRAQRALSRRSARA